MSILFASLPDSPSDWITALLSAVAIISCTVAAVLSGTIKGLRGDREDLRERIEVRDTEINDHKNSINELQVKVRSLEAENVVLKNLPNYQVILGEINQINKDLAVIRTENGQTFNKMFDLLDTQTNALKAQTIALERMNVVNNERDDNNVKKDN